MLEPLNIGRICSFCYGAGMIKNDFEENTEFSECPICGGTGKMKKPLEIPEWGWYD